jgi:Flp pilus assembly protein TadG
MSWKQAAHAHIRNRVRGDDGSVFVESVMVVPILLALLCGVLDFGVGMRDRQLLQGAGRNATRVAAASANYSTSANADQMAMTTLWSGLQSLQNVQILRVVVFKANPTTWSSQASDALASPPAACLTTPTSGGGAGVRANGVFCNIYSSAQVQNATTTWVSAGTACSTTTGYDQYWCPNGRLTALTANANRGPDYLGLYVAVRYTTFTGFLRKTIDMTDTTVVRLEPKS